MITDPQTINGKPHAVQIQCDGALLGGDLAIPPSARGIVLFVHGSGSSRHSPRNRAVAGFLREGGLATLLFDLLTPHEEAIDDRTGDLRFDIEMLARRVVGVSGWLGERRETRDLLLGYFGASTGAAAALVAAAELPADVKAVVSRGGRPDLAGESLQGVQAPTLLIVGGNDDQVVELNEQAMMYLACEKRLRIVPGATHLFEEPGAMEQVSRLARGWFQHYLRPAEPSAEERSLS